MSQVIKGMAFVVPGKVTKSFDPETGDTTVVLDEDQMRKIRSDVGGMLDFLDKLGASSGDHAPQNDSAKKTPSA